MWYTLYIEYLDLLLTGEKKGMNVSVVVSVSDRYLKLLQPFAHLFNKYWSSLQQVYIAGYSLPPFRLPDNFIYHSIRTPQYPKEQWVDGFIDFLEWFQEPFFVLCLEDYFLCRRVDNNGIATLADYMAYHPDIIRIDLTADRLYAGGMRDVGYYGHYDLIEAPQSPYQMSTQTGIWNRKLLLDILKELKPSQHSAWDVELEGTTILNNHKEIRVLGTRQCLVRYVNAMNNATGPNIALGGLEEEDKNMVEHILWAA
jgi:hypothetical protein